MEFSRNFPWKKQHSLASPVGRVIRTLSLFPVHVPYIIRVLLLELVQTHNLRELRLSASGSFRQNIRTHRRTHEQALQLVLPSGRSETRILLNLMEFLPAHLPEGHSIVRTESRPLEEEPVLETTPMLELVVAIQSHV